MLYVNPGTNVTAGLKRRRAAEGALWGSSAPSKPNTPAPSARALPTKPMPTSGGGNISATGQQQMRALVAYARSHNSGRTGGRCYEYVWRYLAAVGYGKIKGYNSLPRMGSAYARQFAEYMNASSANLAEAGLQKLPISNPFSAPPGAVCVVGPGSKGTSHPTAGDITVRGDGPNEFWNDGNMGQWMGTKSTWFGKLLGCYVPL